MWMVVITGGRLMGEQRERETAVGSQQESGVSQWTGACV